LKKLLCGIIWPVSLYKGSGGLIRFSMTAKIRGNTKTFAKIFVKSQNKNCFL